MSREGSELWAHPNGAVDDVLPLCECGMPVDLPHAPGGNLEYCPAHISGNLELLGACLAQPAATVVSLQESNFIPAAKIARSNFLMLSKSTGTEIDRAPPWMC